MVAIIDAASGIVLAERVAWATTPLQRMRGLLFRSQLVAGEALVLQSATQIHTFGLRYPIDVAFCGNDWTVLHIVRNMRPMRVSRRVRAAYVVELPAGTLGEAVDVGAQLRVTGSRRTPS